MQPPKTAGLQNIPSEGSCNSEVSVLSGSNIGETTVEFPITRLKTSLDNWYSNIKTINKDKLSLVYLAKHLQTGQERVIKRIEKVKRTRSDRDCGQDRFRREVAQISQLDHPNILKVYELYEDKKYFYIVSEALTGGYLMDYLSTERHLSEQLVARIIVQVMKALVYCHARGVVHRNLRMDSLILQSAPTNGQVHVIVTGFGSSTRLSLTEKLSMRVGLAIYVAPEVLRSEPSEKADVWGCGVILHMLLCGSPPFNGPNDDAILEKIGREQVIFPSKLWEGISSEAIALLRGMLASDPATRLSMAECLNHSWVQTRSRCESADPRPIISALRNLKAFEAKKRLKQVVLSFMAAHIDSLEETKSLRNAFIEMDTDGDGLLSKEEIVEAYSRLMTRDEAIFVTEKVMRCVDLDKNGFVDYSEFMLAGKNHKVLMTTSNLKTIFNLFDRDSSGQITFSEFKDALKSQHLQTDDEMWASLLQEVDADGNGELNFQEFVKLMLAAVDMEEPKKGRSR